MWYSKRFASSGLSNIEVILFQKNITLYGRLTLALIRQVFFFLSGNASSGIIILMGCVIRCGMDGVYETVMNFIFYDGYVKFSIGWVEWTLNVFDGFNRCKVGRNILVGWVAWVSFLYGYCRVNLVFMGTLGGVKHCSVEWDGMGRVGIDIIFWLVLMGWIKWMFSRALRRVG